MNITENDTFLLCNDTNSTCKKAGHDYNIGVAVTSIVLLCTTTFAGIATNVTGIHRLTKRNWKDYLSLIQLLVTGLVVCGVLAPIQIIRISLTFTQYEFPELCYFQHFLHLLAESCTFVTMIIITYERLQKIYKSSPRPSALTSRKVIVSCSWLLVLPGIIYVIYTENKTPAAISAFTNDCVIHKVQRNSGHLVETINASLFIITLAVMTVMYLLAVCLLWKKMTNHVGSIYPDFSVHSNTSVMVLEPREATSDYIADIGAFPSHSKDSKTSNPDSLTNFYSSTGSRADSIETKKFQKVLQELRSRYIELNPNRTDTQSETTAFNATEISNNDHLSRLRKLSETFLRQSREKAKSSIANALGKMSNISLFSFNEELEKGCEILLNPLKHTRRSAGNVWHEEEMNQNRSLTLRPQSIRQKKKIKKKHVKLKKQYSSDSIGTFSDTSGFTDIKTDSDLSSMTYNTESTYSIMDDGSSSISVILEQPEPETGTSRRPSAESKRGSCSRQLSTESKCGSHSRQPSTDLKQAQNSSSQHSNEQTLGISIQMSDHKQSPDEFRPRSYSSTFKSMEKDTVQLDERFRNRAQTDSSKIKPKNLPDKNKIRSLRNRKVKRPRKNKLLPPITKSSPNTLTCDNRSKFCSSTDSSCSDSCQEYDRPSPRRLKSKSDTIRNRRYSSSEENLDWSDCSTNDIRMPNSAINLNSPYNWLKPQKTEGKLVDSMTQTEENIIIVNNNSKDSELSSEHRNAYPIIRIIGPTVKDCSQIRSPQRTTQNNWFPATNDDTVSGRESQLRVSPSIAGSQETSNSMVSLRSNVNRKFDLRLTIKRSIIMIISLAISYLPTCFTVFLLDHIPTDDGLVLLQISRSIQYLYFSVIPVIYVFTNKGLIKVLTRTPRGS